MTSSSLLRADVTEHIIDSFFDVYRGLGFGFLEAVYANAIAIDLGIRGRRVSREVPVEIHWKGVSVGTYRFDLLVDECVVVEVKSTKGLSEADERQLMNYLSATNIEVGLLLHFGPTPKFRRLVFSNSRKA